MPRWKRAAVWLVLVAFALSSVAALAQGEKAKPFVGNQRSKKYHTAECQWGQKIAPKNRVEFSSAEEAEKAGYVACKICKPDTKKK